MHKLHIKHIPNTALLFILIAPFTILFYAIYVFNPHNAGNSYLYGVQIFADTIAITIISTLWLTIILDIIQPEFLKRKIKHNPKWIQENSLKVDVLLPVANEPTAVFEKTVKAAYELDYSHELYILDDGHDDEVKKLALMYKAHYISRPKHARTFAKSGNLNFGLVSAKGDFFAVFDADHVPKKDFITRLLPFFENEKIAIVQTPQHYTNTSNFIASGTAQAQEIFYKYVQPAKNSYNAAFCVGTNMLYRRKAIDEIGGIPLRDHSEDIWTTILLHEHKWESIFYNKVLAEGRAPDNIASFFRQQNRWARGGFSLFFTHNPLFVTELTTDQRIQYFFSNIHYFSAFSIIIYLSLPIIYLLFGIHSMDIEHNNGWIIHYIPYFLTVYFLPLFLLGSLKTATISASIASFAPYLKAFFSVSLKNQFRWIATESGKKSFSLIMYDIWPHIFIIMLSFMAIIVGWYNPTDVVTTFITSFWVLVNSYFIFSFLKNGLFPLNHE